MTMTMPKTIDWKLAGGAALLVAAALVWTLRPGPLAGIVESLEGMPERLAARWFPAGQGEAVERTPAEETAVRALEGRLDATLVWSSNRDGNHELYLMDIPSMEVRRLTDHPHVDYYARFSPDGERVAFMRSWEEYVSVRNDEHWRVRVIDVDGSHDRKIARQGYRPIWSTDGSEIYFMQGRTALAADAETREITGELFTLGDDIHDVRYGGAFISPTGDRVNVHHPGGFSRSYALPGLEKRVLDEYQSCQGTWAPDGSFVVWVQGQGHGGNRIMIQGADGSDPRVLMDLPGERSHEYFPKVSNDGRWLVWGATDEGHEHDRADYEIFLWEIGTPWEEAIRLTFYDGNDMWPDLYVR